MKNYQLSCAALVVASLLGIVPVRADSSGASIIATLPNTIPKIGEVRDFSPPDLPGTVPLKLDTTAVLDAVNQQLKTRYDAAAGPSGQLTADLAKAAGWGFISDHFSEIDRDNKGYVSYSDVSAFMKARSPLKVPAAEVKPGDKAVHIIE